MTLLDETHQTLCQYLDAVARQREPNAPDLLALFARLDALNQRLAADPCAPAQLCHYMHAKSYRKAWNFFEATGPHNAH